MREPARECKIQMKGRDGEVHEVSTMGASVFEAASIGIRNAAQLWWFDSKALVTVILGDLRWRVRQDRVAAWSKKRRGAGSW